MDHVAFTGDQRDTTRHENRRLIEKKIAPLMGALALREIKASTILRVYKAIHRETPRQADTCKALISQICSYAVMNDLMVANPAREVKSVKQRPKPIYAPDAMELGALPRRSFATTRTARTGWGRGPPISSATWST